MLVWDLVGAAHRNRELCCSNRLQKHKYLSVRRKRCLEFSSRKGSEMRSLRKANRNTMENSCLRIPIFFHRFSSYPNVLKARAYLTEKKFACWLVKKSLKHSGSLKRAIDSDPSPCVTTPIRQHILIFTKLAPKSLMPACKKFVKASQQSLTSKARVQILIITEELW